MEKESAESIMVDGIEVIPGDAIALLTRREILYPKQNFMEFWMEKVLPQAELCIDGLYQFMTDIEDQKIEPGNEPEKYEKLKSKIDAMAIWYVGGMISAVNRANIHGGPGSNISMLNAVSQIHGTLVSDSYWQNVWIEHGHDIECDEAKNLKKLTELVTELITKL
jgi:hypothetical protein